MYSGTPLFLIPMGYVTELNSGMSSFVHWTRVSAFQGFGSEVFHVLLVQT